MTNLPVEETGNDCGGVLDGESNRLRSSQGKEESSLSISSVTNSSISLKSSFKTQDSSLF